MISNQPHSICLHKFSLPCYAGNIKMIFGGILHYYNDLNTFRGANKMHVSFLGCCTLRFCDYILS